MTLRQTGHDDQRWPEHRPAPSAMPPSDMPHVHTHVQSVRPLAAIAGALTDWMATARLAVLAAVLVGLTTTMATVLLVTVAVLPVTVTIGPVSIG